MKKIFSLLVLALFAFSLSVRAQLYVDRSMKLRFGAVAGLNMTQMTTSRLIMEPYGNKTRPGFVVGPTLNLYNPVGGFGGELSALLDLRQATSKSGGTRPVRSLGLDIPLNLTYSIYTSNIAMPFIFVGPQLGINLGHVWHTLAQGTGGTTGHPLQRHWINKKSVFSLNAGVGCVAMETVLVRLNYNYPLQKSGVFEQLDWVTGNISPMGTGKLGAFQIMITYLF